MIPSDYFDYPIAQYVQIATVADAHLPYEVNSPDGLGPHVRLLTNDPTPDEPTVAREIAWVYNHAVYGQFVVLQRAVNKTGAQAEIDELLAVTPGCSSPGGEIEEECNYWQRSPVNVAGGYVAVRVAGDVTTFVRWAENATVLDSNIFAQYAGDFPTVGLLVEIIGPAGEFTPEEAAAVAALV